MLEEPRWGTFLSRLRRRVGAEEVHLLIARMGRGVGGHEVFTHRAPAARRLFPISASYRAAPRMFEALRAGRVYSGDEVAEIYLAGNARARSALRERDRFGFVRLLRTVEAGGVSAWLGIGRAKADFTAAEGALLSSLADHIAIALQYFAAARRERFRASIAAPALSRLGIGWITLDGDGHVLDHDPIAARLFQGLSRRREGGGHHRLRVEGADEAIAAALDAIAGSGAEGRAISTSGPVPIHLLVRSADDLGSGAAAIIYAQGEAVSRGSEQALIDLFSLTRSEARLALLLAEGRSLGEAGADLGLTRETARSYSKSLYAKTGTRGQGDLVRLVVTSLAGLV